MIRKMIEQRIGQVTDKQMHEILDETSNYLRYYSQNWNHRYLLEDVLLIAEHIFRDMIYIAPQENRQKNSDPIERTH